MEWLLTILQQELLDMNACMENDHILERIEKKSETTFFLNKYKYASRMFPKDGVFLQQTSLINLFKENQSID